MACVFPQLGRLVLRYMGRDYTMGFMGFMLTVLSKASRLVFDRVCVCSGLIAWLIRDGVYGLSSRMVSFV